MQNKCENIEYEDIGDKGNAAEIMSEKLGGLEAALGKLQERIASRRDEEHVREHEGR